MNYISLVMAILIAIPTVQAADDEQITYKAPSQDEKTRHVETGSRVGTCKAATTVNNNFKLNLIVPESTGYTHQAQPTLYWAVSQPITAKFEFFIEEIPKSDDDYIEPLVESQFELKASAGIQALSLAQYHVELKKDTNYKWSLRLLCDPQGKKSAEDRNVTGTLKYVALSPELSKRIDQTKAQQLPYLYAQNGFWFDAVEALSKQIQAHPQDKTWRKVRANLLEQVKLSDVAALDRR